MPPPWWVVLTRDQRTWLSIRNWRVRGRVVGPPALECAIVVAIFGNRVVVDDRPVGRVDEQRLGVVGLRGSVKTHVHRGVANLAAHMETTA